MKLVYLLFLFIFIGCSQLPTKRTDRLSIVQGITNSKEIEFSILAPKGQLLRFELRTDQGTIIAPDETKVVERSHSSYVVHKIIFIRELVDDLNLYVFEGEKIVDQRLVGRVPEATTKLRVAVASCMNDHYSKNFKIWDELSKRSPDYLLLIGDNVYATKNSSNMEVEMSPEILWDRYVDTRLSLPIYFQQKLIPIHALWDDHDYGHNDGNSSFTHKESSREIFQTFWAQDLAEQSFARGHGVGGLLSVGDFNFYFLDGRSFRSPNSEGKHLGEDQNAWLLTKLSEESNPSFIIKGDQFFGGYHTRDSFEGKHPADFAEFTTQLSKLSTPFIFLSGDKHYSEIMQFPRGLFGRPSFEITSSPLHAGLSSEADLGNPWRVIQEKDHNNFIFIDNLAQDDHWFMDIESIGENGEVFFRREVAVFIKDLQNNLNEVRKKRRHGRRRYRRIRRSRR